MKSERSTTFSPRHFADREGQPPAGPLELHRAGLPPATGTFANQSFFGNQIDLSVSRPIG